MKPYDIIYWNQFSGLEEPFTKKNMQMAKTFSCYHRTWDTKAKVEELLLDGQNSFRIHSGVEQNVFELIMGAPKMSQGKKLLELEVILKEKTDEFLNLHIEEINDETRQLIGKIKFVKNFKGNKAGCVIYDVPSCAGMTISQAALGTIALAYGAYIFGKLDGNWGRVHLETEESIKELNSSLTQENSVLRQRLNDITEELSNLRNSHLQEITKLNATIQQQKSTITTLSNQVRQLKSLAANGTTDSGNKTLVKKKRNYLAELQDFWADKKVVVVGETEKWKLDMVSNFANVETLDEITFDPDKIRSADYLVINTLFIGHSWTNRAKDIANASDVVFVYVNKTNLNNMSKDILKNFQLL